MLYKEMNDLQAFLFSVPLFFITSILAYVLLLKCKPVYLLIGISIYALSTYMIMMYFTDFVLDQFRMRGYKTHFSHNDMVLGVEIILASFILCIANSIVIVAKNRKRKVKSNDIYFT